jgi:fatty-acid desaturase
VTRQLLIVFVTAFVLTQIATWSTSIYPHRALAHRSLTLHPLVAWLFRTFLWLLTGVSQQQWVAIHRVVAMLGHRILFVFVVAPLINGLGHWSGGQNLGNTAYNSRVLAWLTGGESLHNNHHAFPRSPKFSVRRSERDPSWIALRILAALGLVAVVGTPLRMRPTR